MVIHFLICHGPNSVQNELKLLDNLYIIHAHTISATIAIKLSDVFTFEIVHPPPLKCCLTCWGQNLTCVLGRNVCTVYIIIFLSVAILTQDILARQEQRMFEEQPMFENLVLQTMFESNESSGTHSEPSAWWVLQSLHRHVHACQAHACQARFHACQAHACQAHCHSTVPIPCLHGAS